MSGSCFIGIDGGGTKTEAVLTNAVGLVAARILDGPSAVVGDPGPRALDLLDSCVERLCAEAGVGRRDIAHCVIGLNGIDFAHEYPSQLAAVSGRLGWGAERLTLVNDGIPALWGASDAPACVILQHGTGITSAWRGEYGGETLFDHLNACRCFDLRHEILYVAARMLLGVAPPTPLLDRVLEHLRVPREQYPELLYQWRLPDHDNAAVFTRMAFDLWLGGDAGAEYLVGMAMADYAAFIKAMADKTGAASVVAVLGGGVAGQAPERFWSELAVRLQAGGRALDLRRPLLPPAVGAAIMAAFKAGRGDIRRRYDGLAGRGPV